LVDDQAHQRLGAAYVGWRHDEVKRNRLIPLDQIADAPVAVVVTFATTAIEPRNDMARHHYVSWSVRPVSVRSAAGADASDVRADQR
jgi:hypothetical protein